MKIEIELVVCSQCPNFKASPYPTPDSFERPEYWWCTASDEVSSNEETERHRLFIKKDSHLFKLRKIAGYVEWNYKVDIPEWCPCRRKK